MEKNTFVENNSKKERFEFIFSVNGNIICQRYFWINNFREKSIGSTRLIDAIEECKGLIDADLKSKTNIYLSYTAPQVFTNHEEMDAWLAKNGKNLEHPSFIVLRDTDETFSWDGETVKPYGKQFNRADYIETPSTPSVFKFAFLDNGREVHSISWDGNVYPKFVRMNIDLSNSHNKYEADGIYAPMEAFLMNIFINTKSDLIPALVKKIYTACSEDGEYENTLDWGGKKYPLSIYKANRDYVRSVEASCRKKTEKYFKELNS